MTTHGELCGGGKIVLGVRWVLNGNTRGGNLKVAIFSIGFFCGGRWYVDAISVLFLDLFKVELVHTIPSGNFGQDLLMVVVTQSSTKLLISHV